MTKLTVSPLTRLEGHGSVDLELHEGRLREVRVRLVESPRLFEALVVGRRFDEVPDLICRICAICSAVHKLTSLAALEKALNIRVPQAARLIRELLLLGGHIQSHALHLFCLVLPDFYGAVSVLELLREKNPLAAAGLELKAFGNRLQEVMGGRVIHPVNPVFGGVRHRPEQAVLESLAGEAESWRQKWTRLVEDFTAIESYPFAAPLVGMPLAVRQDTEPTLAGETLALGNDRHAVSDYSGLLAEQTVDYSHARLSCGPQGPFVTGALARQLLRGSTGRRVTAASGGIHDNNAAQLREIGWAVERVSKLLEHLMAAGSAEPLFTEFAKPEGGVGTAAMEAPRGLLIHHYVVDEWGQVVAADVVTPTAINQSAMAAQIMADLADETDPQLTRQTAERIVRSYDPCISCAVHLLEY